MIASSRIRPRGLCPRFHRAVELVGRRWSGAIIHALMAGPLRFNELLGAIPGLSDRLLTERLRELEAEGVVRRDVLCGPPVGVRYSLTDAGHQLGPALGALMAWAARWISLDDAAGAQPGENEVA